MKKAALAVLLLTTSLSTMAQTEKGRWIIGAQVGDFSYQKLRYEQGHSSGMDLTPTVGYFLAKNLLLALAVPYKVQKTNSEYVYNDALNRQIGIGPAVRYYLGKAKVKPFLGFSYSYQWGKDRQAEYGPPVNVMVIKVFTSTFSPNVGVAYFIHRNVALNAGLNYNVGTERGYWTSTLVPDPGHSPYSYRQKSVTLAVGFSVLFGQ
ncbi:hypothetical protein GCM10027347_56740 [Larkinella harenae]